MLCTVVYNNDLHAMWDKKRKLYARLIWLSGVKQLLAVEYLTLDVSHLQRSTFCNYNSLLK